MARATHLSEGRLLVSSGEQVPLSALADDIDANSPDAVDVSYDHTTSELTAVTVQAAIDELKVLIDGLA